MIDKPVDIFPRHIGNGWYVLNGVMARKEFFDKLDEYMREQIKEHGVKLLEQKPNWDNIFKPIARFAHNPNNENANS